MVDLFAYDIVEALGQQGCPLCRVLEQSEVTEMASFFREGWRAGEARLQFYLGGGFCRRHAWLFHVLATNAQSGVPVADIYGRLLERDLELIRGLEAELVRGRTRRLSNRLSRASPCLACDWAEDGLKRKSAFLVEALASDAVRTRYDASEGLCYRHFVAVLEQALGRDRRIARFLVHDWRARLEGLANDLGEYDRKRDYRYAHEPKGAEQDSWTSSAATSATARGTGWSSEHRHRDTRSWSDRTRAPRRGCRCPRGD